MFRKVACLKQNLLKRAILTIIACLIMLLSVIMVITPASATTFSPDRDVHVDEGSPDGNCDTAFTTLRVWGTPGPYFRRRALIHFDLSSIPSGATIDSATLHLYAYENVGGTDKTQNIHRITASWTETGVTWNSRDTGIAWTTPGGDYVSTPTSSASTGTTADVWVEWDVKTDVQAFVDGTPNYGWLIKYETEGGMDGVNYRSREYTEENQWPKLVVIYTAGPTPTPTPTPTPGPGPVAVPEFSPLGLVALIGILSVVLAVTTVGRRRREGQ